MDKNRTITVTSPLMPDLEEYHELLKEIWASKWITNNGQFHKRFESALAEYLGVPFISLFTNGTLPLLTALHALKITGEVITTPYSFVATSHSILWSGCQPVFVDIDPKTGNIDAEKIEAAIGPKTTAIMPVHVYGEPCNSAHIKEIADKYGLKVIYDAAHAFGVKENGRSILEYGDLSTLSFHATKVFNTLEGGALIMHDEATKRRIDDLKDFGFRDEVTVVALGINSKMDEMRAAYGLLNLKIVDEAILCRKAVAKKYVSILKGVTGISLFPYIENSFNSDFLRLNYGYFPIFINAEEFGMTRDELYSKMKEAGILCRRYFYPLISDFPSYRNCKGADNLPNARRMADSVLCLPMHHQLSTEDIQRTLECILTK